MEIRNEVWVLEDNEISALLPKSWSRMLEVCADAGIVSCDITEIAEVAQGFETLGEAEQDDSVQSAVALLEAEFNSTFAPAVLTLTCVFDSDGDDQYSGSVIDHEWQVDQAVSINAGGKKLMEACNQ